MTAATTTSAWDDPRYSYEHAFSDNPPQLGYPPVADYLIAAVRLLDVPPNDVRQVQVTQIFPFPGLAGAGAGRLESFLLDKLTAKMDEERMRVAVAPRAWWWRDDVDLSVLVPLSTIPSVRVLAVALAVPRVKVGA